MNKACEATHDGFICTREYGHDGEHWATNVAEHGPSPMGVVYASWLDANAPLAMASEATLRDYFAAHALADVLGHFSWKDDGIQRAAEMSYRLADAMLAERAK